MNQTTITIPGNVTVPRFTFTTKTVKTPEPATHALSWAHNARNLMEITLGRRYLELKAQAQVAQTYVEDTHETDDDHPFAGLRRSDYLEGASIPTREELHEALIDAKNEVIDAAALGIRVDEWNNNLRVMTSRKPKIGDLVMVPRDIWIDRESSGEPEEERGTSGSCWEELMKPLPMGAEKPRDVINVTLTLEEILDPVNDRRLALQMEKTGKGRITTALEIMSRYGHVQGGKLIRGKMYPQIPDSKAVVTNTLLLAQRMLMKNPPKENYWKLWIRDVSVHFEIPALEYMDLGDRASIWSLYSE